MGETHESDKSHVRRVTNAVTGKKSTLDWILDGFSIEDLSGVFDDMLDGIKDRIIDGVIDMFSTMLGRGSRSRSRAASDHVSYNEYSKKSKSRRYDEDDDDDAINPRTGLKYYGIPTMGEAHKVLLELKDCADEYHRVSVKDLYDACGVSGDFTDRDRGWTPDEIYACKPIRSNGNYILDLPKPHRF